MANVTDLIDVLDTKEKFGLKYFIETGTGLGESLNKILNINFDLFQSCEIEETQYSKNVEKFNRPNIKLHLGSSIDCLPKMLENAKGPTLFFLDAHFPGQGYVRGEYVNNMFEMFDIIPLEKEFNILEKFEHINNSVVVVDDLRIYKPGNYDHGDWEEGRRILGNPDNNFLELFLKDSHEKLELTIHQGCLIYLPKTLQL